MKNDILEDTTFTIKQVSRIWMFVYYSAEYSSSFLLA